MGRFITPNTEQIARCGFVSKTYLKSYLFADFSLNCYNAYAGAHPHFRASWCISGVSCTVKVPVHHNASPVHHTVHHRVHQKGALRCIKGGWLHATQHPLHHLSPSAPGGTSITDDGGQAKTSGSGKKEVSLSADKQHPLPPPPLLPPAPANRWPICGCWAIAGAVCRLSIFSAQ